MNKSVAVIAGDQTHDIVLRPGTTSQDIISQLKLPGNYCLSKYHGDLFGDTEEVFGAVNEGEKLYASPPASVA